MGQKKILFYSIAVAFVIMMGVFGLVSIDSMQKESVVLAQPAYDPSNYCTQKVGEDVEADPNFLAERNAYWEKRFNEIAAVDPAPTVTRNSSLDATVQGGVVCNAYDIVFNGTFSLAPDLTSIPPKINGTNIPLRIYGVVWFPQDLGVGEKRPGVILHQGGGSAMGDWLFDPNDSLNLNSPNATYWGGQLCSKHRAVAMQYDYQGVGRTASANEGKYLGAGDFTYVNAARPGLFIGTITATDPANPQEKGKYWFNASLMQTLYQATRALESTDKVCVNTLAAAGGGDGDGLTLAGFSAGAEAIVTMSHLNSNSNQKWHLALGGTPSRIGQPNDLFKLPQAQTIFVPYMDQFEPGSEERKQVCRMLAYVNPHRLGPTLQNKDMLAWVGDQDEVFIYQGNLDMHEKIPGPPLNTKSLIVESGAKHEINKFMAYPSVNSFLATRLESCTANLPDPVNQPPRVSAGTEQIITLPDRASLAGTVSDDGLPSPSGAVTVGWSKVSGPGSVELSNIAGVDTTVLFSTPGTYILRLGASDGQLSSFADVRITVNPRVGTFAFPGAEGYGAEALSSCRNKPLEVKFVTNTNNAGAGSLRQAILDSDPNKFSVIVFRTGGTIKIPSAEESNKAIWVDGKDCIYLAGQTAPGGGIQLTGPQPEIPLQLSHLMSVASNDVVIRYMKFRQGMVQNVGEEGPLSVGGPEKGFRPNHNIILDHVSFAYPQDGVAAHGDPYTEGVTIQRCLLTGGINTLGGGTAFELGDAFHPRSEGPISENLRKMSLHHCLFSSMSHRTPLVSTGKNVEVINNVIYNWGSRSVEIGTSKDGGDPARTPDIGIITADVINNYYKPGPATGALTDLLRTHGPPYNGDASVYVSGTILDPGKPDPNTDSWIGFAKNNDGAQSPDRFRRLAKLPNLAKFPVSVESAQEAYNQLVEQGDVGAWQRLDCKGSWVANRDSLDQQAVDDVKRRTMAGRIDARYRDAVDEAFYGGYPVLDPGAPCEDSDNDGMPNEFELAYNLNPNDPSDNATDADGDGYLNLEEYVNGSIPSPLAPVTFDRPHIFSDQREHFRITGSNFPPNEDMILRFIHSEIVRLSQTIRPQDAATIEVDLSLQTAGLPLGFYAIELERSSDGVKTSQSNFLITKLGDLGSEQGPRDGVIDIFDVSRMISQWGSTDVADLAEADINPGPSGISAGKVDIFDANKLMANWTL